MLSIKLFGKDGNDMKLYKQLTTIVPNNWNIDLFAIYLCEVVMKQANVLCIYLNPEKDDYIEDVSGSNTLYKESTSKLIFDSYSSLAQSFVDGGKYRWLCFVNNVCSYHFMLLLFILVLYFFLLSPSCEQYFCSLYLIFIIYNFWLFGMFEIQCKIYVGKFVLLKIYIVKFFELFCSKFIM